MNGQRIQRKAANWEPVAAFVCFAGAVLSVVIGFVFTTNSLLSPALHPLLHGIGLTLLIVGIPVLILGGHFLDLRERKIKDSHSH